MPGACWRYYAGFYALRVAGAQTKRAPAVVAGALSEVASIDPALRHALRFAVGWISETKATAPGFTEPWIVPSSSRGGFSSVIDCGAR